MRSIWAWIAAIVVGVFILALIFGGGSSREAYRSARGAISQRVELGQQRIDAAAQIATAQVELALKQAGELPAHEEKADAIVEGIEAISDALKDVAAARGDLALARLDATIALFNRTQEVVQEASDLATDPVVKAKLECIDENLNAARDQVTQAVLSSR